MKFRLRPWHKFGIDAGLWTTAIVLALVLRYGEHRLDQMPYLGFALALGVVSLGIEYVFCLHRHHWRASGIQDLVRLTFAVSLHVLAGCFLVLVIPGMRQVAGSVPFISGMVAMMLLGLVRLLRAAPHISVRRDGVRTVIVGAGEAGMMLARELHRHPEMSLKPVGYLDDLPEKQGTYIAGLPVLGRVNDLPGILRRTEATEVVIAAPSASSTLAGKVLQICNELPGVRVRTVPGIVQLLSGSARVQDIRDLNMEDLLGRESANLDIGSISEVLTNATVLITGAGGSIGSEIVRQILPFQPKRLVLLGRGEHSLFEIEQEVVSLWRDQEIVPVLGDVRDSARLDSIFSRYRPDVVFHAAAHKHVPLLETNVSEAVLNNVLGTRNVVRACQKHRVRRLVNISTDKAVNPASVMGVTKRVCEMVVTLASERSEAGVRFVSVRFGNVLGSRGSVIPTLLRQIRRGGPVTVTHPEMMRYFMTIPEASRLVLQAAGIGKNGHIYLLDMGEPVRIADLAQNLIQLCGAEHVQVEYVGVRPGEKLFEELVDEQEGLTQTSHPSIRETQVAKPRMLGLDQALDALIESARRFDDEGVRAHLKEIVHEYNEATRPLPTTAVVEVVSKDDAPVPPNS